MPKVTYMKFLKFFGLLLFIIQLQSCKVNHFVSASAKPYRVEDSSSIQPDSTISAMILPYQEKVQKDMEVIIGTLATDLQNGRPESPLGNLVADALAEKTEEYLNMEIDFAG